MQQSKNGHGPETILVVEDATHVRKLLRDVLQGAGFEVLTASDVGEAYSIVADYPRPIHLLVSDVEMPEVSGPELALNLKTLRPDMKVLLISAHQKGMVVLNHRWYFIAKDFLPVALLGRINDTLKTEVADQGTDHFDMRV